MPRIKFRLASDYDGKQVNCKMFRKTATGAPICTGLTHPWCLASGGGGPEKCKFRRPKEQADEE